MESPRAQPRPSLCEGAASPQPSLAASECTPLSVGAAVGYGKAAGKPTGAATPYDAKPSGATAAERRNEAGTFSCRAAFSRGHRALGRDAASPGIASVEERRDVEEYHEAAFQHLFQKVMIASLGASSLEPRSWGRLLVGDIRGFSTTALPSEQLDRASMRAPQPRADALLFAAARALHQCHQKDLDDFWHFSGHRLARLWRMLMSRNMGAILLWHPLTNVQAEGSSVLWSMHN